MIGASVLAAALLALLWQGLLLLASLFFPRTVVAGNGTIEIGQRVAAVVFRRETALAAPCNGVFRRIQPAGERIARFGVFGTVRSSDGKIRSLRAPRAGLIAYTYDGQDPPPALSALIADPGAAFRTAPGVAAAPNRAGRGSPRGGARPPDRR